MRALVEIKGIREGLLVILGEGEWQDIQVGLLEHLQAQTEFLRGANLVLDVGNHILKVADLVDLRNKLSDMGLQLWGILSNSPTTELTAQNLGLATRIRQTQPVEITAEPPDTHLGGEEATLVMRTLRSGYKLEHPGHVTIIGDVNPGAEIIAGGNVVVWGWLRGMVHAGANGDESVVICALDLSPTQLRIAGHIALTPQRGGAPQPEMACLRNGQVVAEPWSP
jgi:septum site-determining protein MinC